MCLTLNPCVVLSSRSTNKRNLLTNRDRMSTKGYSSAATEDHEDGGGKKEDAGS